MNNTKKERDYLFDNYKVILEGLGNTFLITFISFIIGIILGIIIYRLL